MGDQRGRRGGVWPLWRAEVLEVELVTTDDFMDMYVAHAADLCMELVQGHPRLLAQVPCSDGWTHGDPFTSPVLSRQVRGRADLRGTPLHVPEKFRCGPIHMWFGSSGLLGISDLNREPDNFDSSCVLSEIPDSL